MPPVLRRGLSAAGLSGVLAFCVGCGEGDPLGREAVSGTVTLDGTPLDKGSISFEPLAADGVRSGSPVAGGAFELPEERGLPPGRYRVRVSAADAGVPAAPDDRPPGESNVVAKERVPKSWNTESEREVEVTAGGENAFDFDVRSSG